MITLIATAFFIFGCVRLFQIWFEMIWENAKDKKAMARYQEKIAIQRYAIGEEAWKEQEYQKACAFLNEYDRRPIVPEWIKTLRSY